MLDLKFVRENIDLVQQNLDNRHTKGDLETFVSAYDERRQLIGKVEELKALRTEINGCIQRRGGTHTLHPSNLPIQFEIAF